MSTEQELKKINPLHKEFQNLLDEDFSIARARQQIVRIGRNKFLKN